MSRYGNCRAADQWKLASIALAICRGPGRAAGAAVVCASASSSTVGNVGPALAAKPAGAAVDAVATGAAAPADPLPAMVPAMAISAMAGPLMASLRRGDPASFRTDGCDPAGMTGREEFWDAPLENKTSLRSGALTARSAYHPDDCARPRMDARPGRGVATCRRGKATWLLLVTTAHAGCCLKHDAREPALIAAELHIVPLWSRSCVSAIY